MNIRNWILSRLPERRDVDFTSTLINQALATARGETVSGLVAGQEIAAGWWGRAFESAEIEPAGVVADILRPHLGLIGRSMVLRGSAVFGIDIEDGRLVLTPAINETTYGTHLRSSWSYLLTLGAPTNTISRTYPRDRVLHLQYAVSPETPWLGISPIEASATTRALLSGLEKRLAEEVGAATGEIIAVPNVESTSQLQSDLRNLKGGVTLVESTSKGWGAGATGAPQGDFRPHRVGGNPPQSSIMLRRQVEESILASCGVPQSALGGSDSGAAREQFRQFLHVTIQPIANKLAHTISETFDADIRFNFDSLFAGDLSGRARAFGSLTKAGMPIERAAALSGLMVED